ncbi:adenosine deaminase [Candidatus Poribacteria bacterium]|nr:adenosine deaminase [Candidatus Poribacteria bacterium]
MTITREMLEKMPKCELHCHLDGSMRVATIIELAEKQSVRLPSHDPAELRQILVQDEAASLVQYLKAFDVTLSVLQDYDSLKRTAFELIEDCARENVVYIEVRFAPILHQRKGMKLTAIVEAVLDGLRAGWYEHGVQWGLIICGMRSSDPKYTLQMAELCIAYKHRGVVGFDLAGAEGGNPAARHKDAFDLILQNNVNVTIHAGEAFGPESISQAVHECGAHRLGHAVRLKEDGDLLNYCCDHRIPLEICLTSNVQTGAVEDMSFHPARLYYDYGLRVCLNTDNRLMSGVTMTDEMWKAHKVLGFNLAELKDITVYAIKSSFLHHRPKVELLDRILSELKHFRESAEEHDTRHAVADIPTEALTDSHKEMQGKPSKKKRPAAAAGAASSKAE